jgi:hypothetical protein
MKYALIIGNNRYTDQKLAQLKTPAADSQALAKVLNDQNIGSFDEVLPLVNRTESQVSRAISTFLANKKPEDLVLLYFSGHGVLDDRGRLFLALKDTDTSLLKSTAISASFIADEMDSCRSKRQILILDCCNSGAFERGTKGQEQKAVTATTFEGTGFGRVVLTASASTQYALEGDQVIQQTELSLFTHFLLEGLQTGKADVNNDGYISLDEWYDYTFGKVVTTTPKQIPHKWSYRQQGDLVIAKNPFFKKKPVELPEDLIRLLESPYSSVRQAAVNELGTLLHSRSAEYTDLARAALQKLTQDDSRTVSQAALKQLGELEKVAQERDATEQAALQQEAREAAARIEQQRAEKVERQKLAREAAEKAKREKDERQAAQIAAARKALSKSFTGLKQDLPKAMPFVILAGILGISIIVVELGLLVMPYLFSQFTGSGSGLTPQGTLTATITPSRTSTLTPTATETLTLTPIIANLPPGTIIEYQVLPGDTLEEIVAKFNSRERDILDQNENNGTFTLIVGKTLLIPVNLVTRTPSLTPSSTRTPIPTRTLTPSQTLFRMPTQTPFVTPTRTPTVTPF